MLTTARAVVALLSRINSRAGVASRLTIRDWEIIRTLRKPNAANQIKTLTISNSDTQPRIKTVPAIPADSRAIASNAINTRLYLPDYPQPETGCRSAWPEHCVRDAGVAGSNPVTPIFSVNCFSVNCPPGAGPHKRDH